MIWSSRVAPCQIHPSKLEWDLKILQVYRLCPCQSTGQGVCIESKSGPDLHITVIEKHFMVTFHPSLPSKKNLDQRKIFCWFLSEIKLMKFLKTWFAWEVDLRLTKFHVVHGRFVMITLFCNIDQKLNYKL